MDTGHNPTIRLNVWLLSLYSPSYLTLSFSLITVTTLPFLGLLTWLEVNYVIVYRCLPTFIKLSVYSYLQFLILFFFQGFWSDMSFVGLALHNLKFCFLQITEITKLGNVQQSQKLKYVACVIGRQNNYMMKMLPSSLT